MDHSKIHVAVSVLSIFNAGNNVFCVETNQLWFVVTVTYLVFVESRVEKNFSNCKTSLET